ncbi:hypothetical protein WG907_11605 [Sphingobium sp. AN558]
MDQWMFVIAAYALTALGVAGISLISWRAMRLAEAEVESLTGRS